MAKKSDSKAMDTALEQMVPFQASQPAGNLPERVVRACEAYGIEQQYLLGWKDKPDDAVVLLTRGGKKVAWHEVLKVEKLTESEITGIPPKKR